MELDFHGTDEQLELYALGRLGESECAAVEDHLLICARCRERLDEAEAFAVSMREALSQAPQEAESAHPWLGWLRRPSFAVLGAVAVLALVVFGVIWSRTALLPIASLQLTAVRGEMASAPPAREIDLTLSDAPQAGGPFRLEVVDAAGQQIWSGTGTEARIHHRFVAGVYFVRLYAAGGQLVREYGFNVRG